MDEADSAARLEHNIGNSKNSKRNSCHNVNWHTFSRSGLHISTTSATLSQVQLLPESSYFSLQFACRQVASVPSVGSGSAVDSTGASVTCSSNSGTCTSSNGTSSSVSGFLGFLSGRTVRVGRSILSSSDRVVCLGRVALITVELAWGATNGGVAFVTVEMAGVAFVLFGERSSGSGEVGTSDFLLVNCRLVLFFDDGPDLLKRGGLKVGSDDGGLNEELVAALGRGRGLFLHGLEQDLHFDPLARLNAAGVGANTVLLGSGSLDLESNGLVVGVGDGQSSLDKLGQGACRRAKGKQPV